MIRALLTLVLVCLVPAGGAAERVAVEGGPLTSVLPAGEGPPGAAPAAAQVQVQVQGFALDRRPVTNAEFLAFVVRHPEWRRGRVASLFADGDYLSHWGGPLRLGALARPDQPVTRISWYAARAYCAASGARLPTWHEWEYVAAADEQHRDARGDAAWREKILNWYGQPAGRPLADVGTGAPNFYGIEDLHGLVWEWVEDFNALIVSGDSRDQGDPDKLAFCGAGALSLQDRDNFAVLMRIAFLSALEARSTARSLGFRCAASGPS